MRTNGRSSLLWAALITAGLIPSMAGGAQRAASGPDAMILVEPAGGQAVLTVSYSGKVPHAAAKTALEKLVRLGGWKMTAPEISDVDMTGKLGPISSIGKQTGTTTFISGAPLAQNGGFRLQPFIEAFRHLNGYKLLFWVAPQQGFQGLRRFENRDIMVELVQEGGPYRYSVTNHTHQGPVPTLPLTQDRPSYVASVAPANAAGPRGDWPRIGAVAAIAMGAGAAVFVVLRLLTLAKNRGRNAALRGRNDSRDPGHTSRI